MHARWHRLISFEKLIPAAQPRQLMQQGRSCFQKDYDRLIYSPAFRRLGDKTQVIPLPGNDFVRNRLTHSLEVACVARSLGETVWAKLQNQDPAHPLVNSMQAADLGAAIAAASLAHDLGNPPFGHFGEAAISDFFRRHTHCLTGLNPFERADLMHFEGNASGFRLLTRTPPAVSGIPGGFNLTLTTLGAFCKYPCDSAALATGIAHSAKYNAFQSERHTLITLAQTLDLPALTHGFARHPLAFLVEAADDICNVMIDFEDGHKLNLIPDEALLTHFRTLATHQGHSLIDESALALCYAPAEKAAYLRVKAIQNLIDLIAMCFLRHEQTLLAGTHQQSLLADLPQPQQQALSEMAQLTDRFVYSHEPVIEIELAGHAVINGLLTMLVEMYTSRDSARAKRLKRLIPEAYFRSPKRDWFDSDYDNILNLACFVSDLTDRSALSLYRKLSGIELPLAR